MKAPLILLHGWGFSSQIWRPLIESLHTKNIDDVFAIDLPGFGSAYNESVASLDELLDYIVEQLPEKCFLGGWSLGGMLAIQIAARWPERIAGIITIGSNLHFTQTEEWPGMPAQDFLGFCERFAAQPEKTWTRFLALQTRGDSDAERSAALLQTFADFSALQPQTAARLLAILGEIDNRAIFSALSVLGLHVLGECDAITPSMIAPLLREQNVSQQIQVLHGSSHVMPLSRTAPLAASITAFLGGDVTALPKQQIARSFSRAASSYDAAAKLQRAVGTALLASLPAELGSTVVDLGCGTGFVTRGLREKADSATVIALDLAGGMIAHTRDHLDRVLCLQADMQQLPLADCGADTLLSSLALQWVEDVAACFCEWRRVLKPGGRLFFATFMPGTLRELEQCWRAVDDDVHVNRFVSQQHLEQALHETGFSHVECVTATHTLYYPQLRDLAVELKAIGAHNMNAGKPAGLTGKQRWQQLQSAYESLRTPRGLPASYEVLYVSAS